LNSDWQWSPLIALASSFTIRQTVHGCQTDTALVITKKSTDYWENNLSLHSTLRPEQIVKTVNTLEGRIEERFPDSSLRQVCHELAEVSEQMVERSAWIGKPILWLRVITWAVCIGIIVGTAVTFFALDLGSEDFSSLQSSPDRLSTFVTRAADRRGDFLYLHDRKTVQAHQSVEGIARATIDCSYYRHASADQGSAPDHGQTLVHRRRALT